MDDLCQAAESVDVIVAHGHPIPSEVIDSADNLGLIATTASGAERVAVADASRRGVLVQTTASSGTTAAAEVIISLMFSAARHIVQADASLKAGKWCKHDFEGIELRNKTLCLVGVDPVGAHVATLARALGCVLVRPFGARSPRRERSPNQPLCALAPDSASPHSTPPSPPSGRRSWALRRCARAGVRARELRLTSLPFCRCTPCPTSSRWPTFCRCTRRSRRPRAAS